MAGVSSRSQHSMMPCKSRAERKLLSGQMAMVCAGLSKRTTSEGLREAFSKFGNLIQARVVTDRISGYSKGFGFVRYATTEEAVEAIKGMDGKFLDGWVIFAEYAKPRPPPQGQSSQSPQYTNSASPSSPASQMSQSWSSYRSPPTSDPQPGYSSYEPRESQPPSNYSPHAPETPPPPSYGSAPPSNYSSDTPPSSFASVGATNYAWASPSTPNYAPSSPEASKPSNASVHRTSEPLSQHASNNSSRNSETQSENQIFETLNNFDSLRSARSN
ncbi:hypothetical protein KSP40_PGU001425 [Platanthera guangdongensis]|uniref:RRM domain-containing protein n=1 Tax=Platanthera guangdongensis TaxID=2320717 RepID=A0ABR2MT32_9ASPA